MISVSCIYVNIILKRFITKMSRNTKMIIKCMARRCLVLCKLFRLKISLFNVKVDAVDNKDIRKR